MAFGRETRLFQRTASGATTKKIIYKIYHQYAYPLAPANDPPQLRAESIEDKNGHILPYVKFVGGSWSLTEKAVSTLSEAASAKKACK
jgi:hypothetical protein